MSEELPAPRIPPILPYAIGGFMALPFVLWGVLWLFVFPGNKNGFDSAISTVMFVVSAPLVLWFFFCSLGFIANSMAGDNEFDGPQSPLITQLIAVLPATALFLGLAGGLYLLSIDKPLFGIVLPLLLAAVIAVAIWRGERARSGDKLAAKTVGRRERILQLRRTSDKKVRHILFWAVLFSLAAMLFGLSWSGDARVIVAGFAIAALVVFATMVMLPRSRSR